MKIILMGKAGSGKGTFAQMLSKEFKLEKISTGDILRLAVKNKTELGKLAKSYLDKGIWVPDEPMAKLVKKLLQGKENFVLEGFPRTLKQAEVLDKITKINKVVYLVCSDKAVIDRIAGRVQCKKCERVYHLKTNPPKKKGICDICGGSLYIRADETEKIFKKRLESFEKQATPVVEYYKNKNLLVEINGNRSIAEVYSDIRKLFI